MKKIICLLALGALVMPALAQESARSRIDQPTTTNLPQLGEAFIQEVIAAMTLEEKAHLLVGMGMRLALPPAGLTIFLTKFQAQPGARMAFLVWASHR